MPVRSAMLLPVRPTFEAPEKPPADLKARLSLKGRAPLCTAICWTCCGRFPLGRNLKPARALQGGFVLPGATATVTCAPEAGRGTGARRLRAGKARRPGAASAPPIPRAS